MNSKTLIKFGIGILLISLSIWYFILKDHDYKVTFTTPQSPGAIYTNILAWNNWENSNKKVVETIANIPYKTISQRLKLHDSLFVIDWKFNRINDSTTKVIGLFTDKNNSFKQKLLVPFTKSDFVKRALYTMKSTRHALKEHAKEYKVSKIEKKVLESQHCVYIPVKCEMPDKANQMIRNVTFIMNFIKDNNFKLNGDPFLEIKAWNKKENTITFDFCFPVEAISQFPDHDELFYKTTKTKNALKTTFNGNYRISDRAWFSLIDYAESNAIPIEQLPTEVFKNDPHGGGDPLQWEADIYMPLAD